MLEQILFCNYQARAKHLAECYTETHTPGYYQEWMLILNWGIWICTLYLLSKYQKNMALYSKLRSLQMTTFVSWHNDASSDSYILARSVIQEVAFASWDIFLPLPPLAALQNNIVLSHSSHKLKQYFPFPTAFRFKEKNNISEFCLFFLTISQQQDSFLSVIGRTYYCRLWSITTKFVSC